MRGTVFGEFEPAMHLYLGGKRVAIAAGSASIPEYSHTLDTPMLRLFASDTQGFTLEASRQVTVGDTLVSICLPSPNAPQGINHSVAEQSEETPRRFATMTLTLAFVAPMNLHTFVQSSNTASHLLRQ